MRKNEIIPGVKALLISGCYSIFLCKLIEINSYRLFNLIISQHFYSVNTNFEIFVSKMVKFADLFIEI